MSRAWADANRDELVSFLRAWLGSVRWANEPANRKDAMRLIAEEERLGRGGAAARLARLPQDGAMDISGLQVVLDLRKQFGFSLPVGLERYYNLEYLTEAEEA